MKRGEIWWANLGLPFGSEPGLRRPVLILQDDDFNRSAIQTVIVVPLSTNLTLGSAPGNVRCSRSDTGLPRVSVANVSQLASVDRRRLEERAGRLTARRVTQVEAGVRLILGL